MPARIFSRLGPSVFALLIVSLSSGCAATIAAIGPQDVMTSSEDSVTLLGARVERVRDVRYTASDRSIVCRSEWRHPRERVHHRRSGYDVIGRIAIGSIGGGEMLFGAAMMGGMLNEPQLGVEEWTLATVGALFALDGIATVLLSFLLEDYELETTSEREGRWQTFDTCPADAELRLGGAIIAPGPGGRFSLPSSLTPTDTLELSLRHGGEERSLSMNSESRCALAASLGIEMHDCRLTRTPASPAVSPVSPPTLPGELELHIDLNVDAAP